jgi:hypothetical protein
MKPLRGGASPLRKMARSRRAHRPLAALLAAAAAVLLTACSSAPRPPSRPPTGLAEINRALSWHFADVTLASEVVMRGLRGVEVTPEHLRWTNESGQRREMPIAEVARIVQRSRDPAAQPPTEGARMLTGTPPFPLEPEAIGTPLSGSFEGDSALIAGAVYGALYLASASSDEPAVLLYEAPVTRYLATIPAANSESVPQADREPPPLR